MRKTLTRLLSVAMILALAAGCGAHAGSSPQPDSAYSDDSGTDPVYYRETEAEPENEAKTQHEKGDPAEQQLKTAGLGRVEYTYAENAQFVERFYNADGELMYVFGPLFYTALDSTTPNNPIVFDYYSVDDPLAIFGFRDGKLDSYSSYSETGELQSQAMVNWDENGTRHMSLTKADGEMESETFVSFDEQGRESRYEYRWRDSEVIAEDISYDESGRISMVSYPGSTRYYYYDESGNLIKMVSESSSTGQMTGSYEYFYHNDCLIEEYVWIQMGEDINDDSDLTREYLYEYDDEGRLQSISRPVGESTMLWMLEYDADGNVVFLAKTRYSGEYAAYSGEYAADRIISDSAYAYFYDEHGFLTEWAELDDTDVREHLNGTPLEDLSILKRYIVERNADGSIETIYRRWRENSAEVILDRFLERFTDSGMDEELQTTDVSYVEDTVAEIYTQFLLRNSIIQSELVPDWLSLDHTFRIDKYAAVDVTGDGVWELLLEMTDADIPYGVLVCGIGEGNSVVPLWYMDVDRIFSDVHLVDRRWLLTIGSGTGGYSRENYMTMEDSVLLTLTHTEDGEGGSEYDLDGRYTDAQTFEQYLLDLGQTQEDERKLIQFRSVAEPILVSDAFLETDTYYSAPDVSYWEDGTYLVTLAGIYDDGDITELDVALQALDYVDGDVYLDLMYGDEVCSRTGIWYTVDYMEEDPYSSADVYYVFTSGDSIQWSDDQQKWLLHSPADVGYFYTVEEKTVELSPDAEIVDMYGEVMDNVFSLVDSYEINAYYRIRYMLTVSGGVATRFEALYSPAY